jgi:hypothetical protein
MVQLEAGAAGTLNHALGQGQSQQLSAANSAVVLHCLRARFNPIWEFGYTIQDTQCDMVFTSVAGHLMQMDFTQQHRRWHSCNPLELYTAPVVKTVPDVSLCTCQDIRVKDCLHAAGSMREVGMSCVLCAAALTSKAALVQRSQDGQLPVDGGALQCCSNGMLVVV